MFEDWFKQILLLFFRKLESKVAIVGDNLPSHLPVHIVHLCENNGLKFILLSSNSDTCVSCLTWSFLSHSNLFGIWMIGSIRTEVFFPSTPTSTFEKVGMNCAANIQAGF